MSRSDRSAAATETELSSYQDWDPKILGLQTFVDKTVPSVDQRVRGSLIRMSMRMNMKMSMKSTHMNIQKHQVLKC